MLDKRTVRGTPRDDYQHAKWPTSGTSRNSYGIFQRLLSGGESQRF